MQIEVCGFLGEYLHFSDRDGGGEKGGDVHKGQKLPLVKIEKKKEKSRGKVADP